MLQAIKDVRAGDHLKIWYDDSTVWIYLTGVEDWEQAKIWGEEDELGEGGFEFYVDVNGNTYYDQWCCQTAYCNTAPKSGKLWIGGHQPNEYFNGIIDEVSIYDEVLSAAAIWDLYFLGPPPTPTPTP